MCPSSGFFGPTQVRGWTMIRLGFETIPWLLAAMFVSGCAGSPEETSSDVGTARSALLNLNSLDARTLSADPAHSGRLTPAMLAQGSLAAWSSSPVIQDPGDNAALSRQLLAYT